MNASLNAAFLSLRGPGVAAVSLPLSCLQRPFHPQRLLELALSQSWQGVLRTKGFYWLATRHDVMGLWQSAGGAWQGEPRCPLPSQLLYTVFHGSAAL